MRCASMPGAGKAAILTGMRADSPSSCPWALAENEGAEQGEGRSGTRGGFPDMDDGCCLGACTGVGKAVEVFNRAQDIVVGDPLVGPTGLHHGPDEERHDPVILFPIVLIPSHDQQTIVLLCPLDVGIQVFPEPPITSLNLLGIVSVVHVVDQVRHDHADGRELAVLSGKFRQRHIGRRWEPIATAVLPIHPGAMPACVQSDTADEGADRGEVFRVSGECQPRSQQRVPKIGCREGVRAGVISCVLSRSRKQREIVRLAGVGDAKGLREDRALGCQAVDVRRIRRIDYMAIGVIFFNHHHNVVGPGKGRRAATLRRRSRVGAYAHSQRHGNRSANEFPPHMNLYHPFSLISH